MSTSVYTAVLIAVMAAVTMLLRWLPFLIFHKHTPSYILYLGKVLPAAIIGMLVIYCLKDVYVLRSPYGLPELMAGAATVGIHVWKRNSLVSILYGTIVYMILIQLVF